MKKIIAFIVLMLSAASFVRASEVITLDLSDSKERIAIQDIPPKQDLDSIIEHRTMEDPYIPAIPNAVEPIVQKQSTHPLFTMNNAFSSGLSKIYHLEVESTDKVTSLLRDYTTFNFENGLLETLNLRACYQNNFDTTIPQKGKGNTAYNPRLIQVILEGTFKGSKEGFKLMFDPTPVHGRSTMSQLIQDVYVYSTRVPHHRILVGNSRVGIGDEGRSSSYVLPLINRSQAARELSNVRKLGVRVQGDYKLIDYDFGGYSSSTFFQSFFPGAEFNGWVNLKPLGLTNGKYGNLVTGGGISAGRCHSDYFLSGAYAGYQYKKFWVKFEYMHANGSNSQLGTSKLKRSGLFATVAYKLTPKLELVARYDQFDPNEKIKHNYSREYTAGINYYLKGQALKLMLNYVFCQRQNANDSHQIIVGTQIIL